MTMIDNSQAQFIYQKTMSKALERILHTDDIQEAFSDVLHDVLYYFKAGRVAIMSTDRRNPDLQYCVFEVLAEGVSSSMDGREESFRKHRWWYDKLEAGECVVVDDAYTKQWDDPTAAELLASLGVRAHLGVPIIRYGKISGFLAIDILDRPYLWSEADLMWLKDLANLMMLWRRLQRSREDVASERNKLEKVLRDMPIGLCLYNIDGSITFANDRAMNIFGVKSFEEAKVFNLFRSTLLTEQVKRSIREQDMVDASFEYSYGKMPFEQVGDCNSMRITVMARYSKLYSSDGEMKAYLVAYVDKTREQNNSQKIHELDEIISLTADFAQLGYARINVIDNTGYATRQWYKNNKMPIDDSSTGISDFVDLLHPDDRKVSDDFRNAVRQGKNVRLNRRMRIRRPGEKDAWDYLQVYSVVTKYEPQYGVIEISTLTQCVNHQVRLEHSLLKAKEEAEQADKLKSAFLANMSHEIRTPLNAIVGFSQMLCHNDVPEQEKNEMMKIVEENNELLLQLISDILDLSKLEAGTLEFVEKDVDVNNICKAVAASIEMKVKDGVKVKVECQKEECHIMSDPNRLKQVLINFASNAAKFTNRGHIIVGYHFSKKDRIRFFVEDTGIGIPEDMKAKIFERFVKLNSFVQGTGLGLQISKEIVQRLGGVVGVESEPGEGSMFWFDIPVENGVQGAAK